MSFKRKKVGSSSTAYLYLEGNPQPIPLFDKYQFGRMESFDNPAVSRTHFTISANEHGVYFILDHESLAGTRINGKQIKPGEWHEIDEGHIIAVGPYKFEFSFKPAHKQSKLKVQPKSKVEVENKNAHLRSNEKDQRRVSSKNLNSAPISLERLDSSELILENGPRIASPTPQRPRQELRSPNVPVREDNSSRVHLFLMICVVVAVLTVVVVQNRKLTSREQMLPYYTSYMSVMNQYFKNYDKYQKKEKEISRYENDQALLVQQLRELESDLREERSVDRKADYYKKHILFLVGKTASHSENAQKYFRTGKFNYFSLAKQDAVDITNEMNLMSTALGLKTKVYDLKDRESQLRVPAAMPVSGNSQDTSAQDEKVRGKKSRTPF